MVSRMRNHRLKLLDGFLQTGHRTEPGFGIDHTSEQGLPENAQENREDHRVSEDQRAGISPENLFLGENYLGLGIQSRQ